MIDNLLPLVSVIIPVYNTDGYIDCCLQSVLRQSYKNLEIIVVNDGSTDKSSIIIDEYVQKDLRVIKVDKKNEGLVKARKSGIDIAQGKYIQYLDGDDSLTDDAIEKLVNKAEKTSADIVIAPFFWCHEHQTIRSSFEDFEECSGLDYLKWTLQDKAYWCIWSKFHLRSLYYDIESIDISFGEDVVLSTQLLFHAQKVVAINEETINYTVRSTSISHYKNFDDDKYKDFEMYVTWLKTYILNNGLSQCLEKELAIFQLQNAFKKIEWGRYRDASKDMRIVNRTLRFYPNLRDRLTRRQKKIIRAYNVCNFLGYLRLLIYNKQGKI